MFHFVLFNLKWSDGVAQIHFTRHTRCRTGSSLAIPLAFVSLRKRKCPCLIEKGSILSYTSLNKALVVLSFFFALVLICIVNDSTYTLPLVNQHRGSPFSLCREVSPHPSFSEALLLLSLCSRPCSHQHRTLTTSSLKPLAPPHCQYLMFFFCCSAFSADSVMLTVLTPLTVTL